MRLLHLSDTQKSAQILHLRGFFAKKYMKISISGAPIIPAGLGVAFFSPGGAAAFRPGWSCASSGQRGRSKRAQRDAKPRTPGVRDKESEPRRGGFDATYEIRQTDGYRRRAQYVNMVRPTTNYKRNTGHRPDGASNVVKYPRQMILLHWHPAAFIDEAIKD